MIENFHIPDDSDEDDQMKNPATSYQGSLNVIKSQGGVNKMKSVFKNRALTKDHEFTKDFDQPKQQKEYVNEFQNFANLSIFDKFVFILMFPIFLFMYIIPNYQKY